MFAFSSIEIKRKARHCQGENLLTEAKLSKKTVNLQMSKKV